MCLLIGLSPFFIWFYFYEMNPISCSKDLTFMCRLVNPTLWIWVSCFVCRKAHGRFALYVMLAESNTIGFDFYVLIVESNTVDLTFMTWLPLPTCRIWFSAYKVAFYCDWDFYKLIVLLLICFYCKDNLFVSSFSQIALSTQRFVLF